MMYLSSDFHLGHKAICKYRDVFSSAHDHDEYIFDLLAKLGKRDQLFVLGDFLFDGPHFQDYCDRIAKLPLRIKLLMGNHDSRELYKWRPSNVSLELPLRGYKSFWLSHAPIHPYEMRGRTGNLHGHLHKEIVMKDDKPDPLYFNVNLDVNDYQFVPLDTIKSTFGLQT